MDLFNFLSFIFSVCAGLGSVYLIYQLHKRYRARYLSIYLYFLITFNTLGFLNLSGRQIGLSIARIQAPDSLAFINYLIAFLGFPFVPISIYFFAYFTRELVNKEISPLFNKIYFGLWSLVFLAFTFSIKNYFDTNNEQFLETFLPSINILAISSFSFATLYLIWKAKVLLDKDRRKIVRNTGFLYALCFGVSFASTSRYILPYLGSYGPYVMIFLFFTLNFPPILYLMHNMSRLHVEPWVQPLLDVDLDPFFKRYQITPREQEIIRLILEGKSNTDIEKELYISLHTVKNHIYNIYQKLEIKNRLQITSLIQNFLKENRKD
jgi:DNA-binding CsgD family transcriptional regulator